MTRISRHTAGVQFRPRDSKGGVFIAGFIGFSFLIGFIGFRFIGFI